MKTTNKELLASLMVAGKAFKVLDERERKILRLRYGLEDGEPKTLEQIAIIENVTRERIRQIESQAIDKIDTVLKYEE